MNDLISSSESCSDLNSNACISLSANVYSQHHIININLTITISSSGTMMHTTRPAHTQEWNRLLYQQEILDGYLQVATWRKNQYFPTNFLASKDRNNETSNHELQYAWMLTAILPPQVCKIFSCITACKAQIFADRSHPDLKKQWHELGYEL